MNSRRDFLRIVAALGAASVVPAGLSYPRTDPEKRRIKRIGIQLYTIREAMKKDFEGSLKTVASIGYRELEFAGYYGKDPVQLRKFLDSLSLTAPATHLSVNDLEERWDSTLRTAHALGHRYLVVASVPLGKDATVDDYKRYAARFNTLGEKCRKEGLTFGYHNHDAEFYPIGGVLPYDVFLKETDPALVTMELDIAWIIKAGQDPLAYFKNHPGRFSLFHVKDLAKSAKGETTEIGSGRIDFKPIFAASAPAVKHFFVEQEDFTIDAFESITRSWKYLNELEY